MNLIHELTRLLKIGVHEPVQGKMFSWSSTVTAQSDHATLAWLALVLKDGEDPNNLVVQMRSNYNRIDEDGEFDLVATFEYEFEVSEGRSPNKEAINKLIEFSEMVSDLNLVGIAEA